MNIFRKKKPTIQVAAPEVVIVQVPLEVMNTSFERSAGRWCDHCEQNGSHHTDRHNEFAMAARQLSH